MLILYAGFIWDDGVVELNFVLLKLEQESGFSVDDNRHSMKFFLEIVSLELQML